MPRKSNTVGSDGLKLCGTCKLKKPAAEFYKKLENPDGLRSFCKACGLAQSKRWAERNPERMAANARKHYEANKERTIAAALARYAADRAEWRARERVWREAHPESARIRSAAYRAAHPERVKAARAGRYQRNPERGKHYTAKRRALKRGGAVGTVDYAAILARDGLTCGICGLPVERTDVHFDHVVPLSKGGAHTEANIQVAHSLCNMRKGARPI